MNWIADYRDLPYYDDPNRIFYLPRIQLRILKIIIRKADIRVTISNGLRSFFEKYGEVHLLRNGMNDTLQIREKQRNNKFTISYTGTLYNGKRDPSILFKALRFLIDSGQIVKDSILLQYAGKEGDLWLKLANDFDLGSNSVNLGLIPLKQSVELQRNTDINLLLTWSIGIQKGILTGKFYEYLQSNNPILVIVNGERDVEFEEILDRTKSGIVVYSSDTNSNESLLVDFILDAYNDWRNEGFVRLNSNEIEVNSFTWDNQFNKFKESLFIR